MKYGKGGKSMSSPKGIFSKKDNTMAKPNKTSTRLGPSQNKDCMKANKLLQKAQKQQDSLRGSAGKI